MVGENRTEINKRNPRLPGSSLRVIHSNRGEDRRGPAYGASVTQAPLHPESGWFCLNYDTRKRRERIPPIVPTYRAREEDDTEMMLLDVFFSVGMILLFFGLAACYIALAFAAVDLPLPGQ